MINFHLWNGIDFSNSVKEGTVWVEYGKILQFRPVSVMS